MSVIINKFSMGKQPCKEFRPHIEYNEFAEWENRHQCYKCGGTVSFCENCCTDHHENGYESCVEKED